MDVETTISAIHTLSNSLKDPQLNHIFSIIGHESQLDDFERMVNIILAMLPKVGAAVLDPDTTQMWLTDIENAVDEANVELEELVSVASQNQFSKTMRLCYYHFKIPSGMSQVVQNFQRVLETRPNTPKFDLDVDFDRKLDAACSYFIGRKNDLEIIMSMLLSSTNRKDVSFLSIAGVAGLGKTTLVQHLYDDDRVKLKFPFRMWVCVSDHGQKQLNLKFILDQILQSLTGKTHEVSSIQDLKQILCQKMQMEKYLLVLDDLWTEKPDQLHQLVNCLTEIGGQSGSWIIVSTRSRRTASKLGGQLYELQGLSDEDSLKLFQRMAFEPNEYVDKDLIEIGQGILAGCAGNPLAIRVAGSLLHGQDKRKWQTLRDIGLASIRGNEIILSFRLSYDYLEPQLKSCFRYCALFPKDFTVNKDMLISLWMAQKYINSLIVGEDYFLTLLDRYFFKDIKRDEYGEIVSCKINDIIRDLAQHVAENEMYTLSDFQNKPDEGVRHVSVLGGQWVGYDFLGNNNTNILSYLHVGYKKFHICKVTKSSLELLLTKCINLRALDLGGLLFKSLPDSIGELSQLRYLNLSGNPEIEVLPRTITKLGNLQTLNLQKCCKLKELPKDFIRLFNLRMLNIRNCSSLTCMPWGMRYLDSLCRLSDFKVGDKRDDSSWKEVFAALENLKPLQKLQGPLNIEIRCPSGKYVTKKDARSEGIYRLKNLLFLKAIKFDFEHEEVDGELDIKGVTRLMKQLQPPSNLQYIKVCWYKGVRMGWNIFPSNLVQLVMVGCSELECLPCLGNLRHLKVLQLLNLKKLVYIGQDDHQRQVFNDEESGSSSSYSDNKAQWQLFPCFSKLKSLLIWNCPQLIWILQCPIVEDLKLFNFSSSLRIMESIEKGKKLDVASSSSFYSGVGIPESSSRGSYIKNGKNIKVVLSNVVWLNSLPMEAFKRLENLEILCDKEVKNLGEVEEVFRSCSSSLKVLIIHNCSNLKTVVPGGLEHLTLLEKLELRNCDNLTLSEEQGEGEERREDNIVFDLVNWSSNLSALHTLKLEGLPQLVNLPDWIQFLPDLRYLCISFCNRLKSMPEWLLKITSIRQIIVHGCSASLEKEHEDWPHIQFRNCVF